mmetsp:Transcript_27466/g.89484  ORF Transcript_27466/g.89484 Transcript_27466/m.89484 type:complete len:111 (+) Transcript_27466:658-990(+)
MKAQATAVPPTPGTDGKKRRKKKNNDMEENEEGSLTKPHPLFLKLRIPPKADDSPSAAPTITLTFSYLTTLQIVVVQHELSSKEKEPSFLQDLFSNDSGIYSPLVANDYL